MSVHIDYLYVNSGVANICISWKTEANWFVLKKLLKGEPCSCTKLSKYSEMTALNYAIFDAINTRLMGDPKAQASTKCSKVCCNYSNGHFTICITVPASLSAVRKALNIAVYNFRPSAMYAGYCTNIKILNGRPDKKEFAWCCNNIGSPKMHVMVVGKVNLGKENSAKITGLNIISESCNAKVQPYKKITPDAVPVSHAETMGDTEFPTLKSSSKHSTLLLELISDFLPQSTAINSNELIIYDKGFKMNDSMRDRLGRWCDSKFGKIDNLSDILTWHLSTKCVDCETLNNVANSKITTSELKKALLDI